MAQGKPDTADAVIAELEEATSDLLRQCGPLPPNLTGKRGPYKKTPRAFTKCVRCDTDLPAGHPRSRCWGCAEEGRKPRTAASRIAEFIDIKSALHTVRGALDKLGETPRQLTFYELKRLHEALRADLELVERTLAGVR